MAEFTREKGNHLNLGTVNSEFRGNLGNRLVPANYLQDNFELLFRGVGIALGTHRFILSCSFESCDHSRFLLSLCKTKISINFRRPLHKLNKKNKI